MGTEPAEGLRRPAPGDAPSLHALRLLGLLGPLAFFALLHALYPWFDRLAPDRGHLVTDVLTGVTAVAFGLVMYHQVDRAHRTAQHRAVEAEHRAAVLAERDRIARELHDSLAQALAATHLRLRALVGGHPLDPHTSAELTDIADGCSEAYTDVREAIWGLRESLRDHALLDALARHVDDFARRTGVDARLEVDGDVRVELAVPAQEQVVRIVQEALANVRKHAAARRVRVSLGVHGVAVVLRVEDDGRGFDPRARPEGHYGLRVMAERAALVGGRLSVASAHGRGTRIELTVPSGPTALPHVDPSPSEVPA